MKKAMINWYKWACNPLKAKAINSRIPLFFYKGERLSYFYNKWRSIYLNRTRQALTNDKALSRCLAICGKVARRRQLYYFVIWRDRMIRGLEGLKCFRRCFIKHQQ